MAISIRGAGSWAASNATTQTVTLPTHQAGDMLIVRAACKPYTATPTCGTTGWAAVGSAYANGSTANGNGVGSLTHVAFYKIATSASETNPVVSWGTTSAPGAAVAVVYQKGASESWLTPVGAGGGDSTARTSQTCTISSHISVTAGDMVDFFLAWCDNYASTSPTITQTGVTYGTVSEQPATALSDSTSNDIAADGGYRLASSGTSSAAAVVTATFGNSEQGGAWQTRLRVEAANPVTCTPGVVSLTTSLYAPTVTATDNKLCTPTLALEKVVTVAFSCGFEDAALTTHWSVSGSSGSGLDTGVYRTGTKSGRVACASSVSDYIGKAHTANGVLALRLAFRFSALPSVTTTFFKGNGVSVWNAEMRVSSAGVLTYAFSGGSGSSSSTGPTISANTWYVVDFLCDGTNRVAKWRVNETAYSDPTCPTGAETFDSVLFGNFESSAGGSFNLYIDDFVRSTVVADYPIPNGGSNTSDVHEFYSLSLTTFVPTVTVGSSPNKLCTPPAASLTTSLYAPTVTAPRLCTPPAATLTTATFAPVLKTQLTPPTATLALTTYAPGVTTPRLCTPPAASLTTATFAPVLKLVLTPPAASLATARFAPTVTATDNRLCVPPAASLALASFVPTVTAPRLCTPPAASLTLATFAPTVTAAANRLCVPPAATLALTTYAPGVVLGGNQWATPTPASLTTNLFAPTVTATDYKLCTPPALSLALSAFVPTVTATDHKLAVPLSLALLLATYAPLVATGGAIPAGRGPAGTVAGYVPLATARGQALPGLAVTIGEPIARAKSSIPPGVPSGKAYHDLPEGQ